MKTTKLDTELKGFETTGAPIVWTADEIRVLSKPVEALTDSHKED